MFGNALGMFGANRLGGKLGKRCAQGRITSRTQDSGLCVLEWVTWVTVLCAEMGRLKEVPGKSQRSSWLC